MKSIDLFIALLAITVLFAVSKSNADYRHQEQIKAIEQLSEHIHFMDSVHYSNCDFIAIDSFKPYGSLSQESPTNKSRRTP
jgi:hypothetical protein